MDEQRHQKNSPVLDNINFKNLQISDLRLMHKWLNTDFVSQWYGQKSYSYEEVFKKYSAKISAENLSNPFLILYAQTPIGYIQSYKISDYPDYNKYVQAEEKTVGIDLFIGEDDYIHKGFGTAILTKFLAEIIFSDDSIVNCIIGPEPKNKAAIRCYEKVGFRYFKTIQIIGEAEPEYLMRINKENL